MRYSLLLLVATSTWAASPWQSLIQKDSFAGWRSPSGHTPIEGAWTIHNGTLTVKPHVNRRTDLWSTEDYENFELEWEWKASKAANSGIKYWVQSASTLIVIEEDKKWRAVPDPRSAAADEVCLEYTRGLEYQMTDDQFEPTSLIRTDSRAGGLYSLYAPSPENVRPHGHWNRSRILVHHGRFEHWLNGKRVAAFTLEQLQARMAEKKVRYTLEKRRAPIALQYHQTEVSFRKMRIRRLD